MLTVKKEGKFLYIFSHYFSIHEVTYLKHNTKCNQQDSVLHLKHILKESTGSFCFPQPISHICNGHSNKTVRHTV